MLLKKKVLYQNHILFYVYKDYRAQIKVCWIDQELYLNNQYKRIVNTKQILSAEAWHSIIQLSSGYRKMM